MERKKYTPEDKANYLAKADELVKSGMTMKDAGERLGIHSVTLYKWKSDKKLKSKTPRPYKKRTPKMETLVVPEATPGPVFCFYGDPTQIARTIRELT